MTKVECNCGNIAYSFLTTDCVWTKCSKCGKKLYLIKCPDCEETYSFNQDAKELNIKERSWQCAMCKFGVRSLPPEADILEVPNYRKEGIPVSVWEEYKKGIWKSKVMLIAMVVFLFAGYKLPLLWAGLGICTVAYFLFFHPDKEKSLPEKNVRKQLVRIIGMNPSVRKILSIVLILWIFLNAYGIFSGKVEIFNVLLLLTIIIFLYSTRRS